MRIGRHAMRERLRLILLAWLLLVTAGCGTPPQVKALSVKQIEYFDAAIAAVSLQSEALILATERLVKQAKEQIDSEQDKSRALLEEVAREDIPAQPEGDRARIAKEMLERANRNAETAQAARAKLDADLAVIKERTEELKTYLLKMRETQKALDAYLQSEQAGEIVMRDVLSQPSVKALLASTDALLPKVQAGMQEIQVWLKKP